MGFVKKSTLRGFLAQSSPYELAGTKCAMDRLS